MHQCMRKSGVHGDDAVGMGYKKHRVIGDGRDDRQGVHCEAVDFVGVSDNRIQMGEGINGVCIGHHFIHIVEILVSVQKESMTHGRIIGFASRIVDDTAGVQLIPNQIGPVGRRIIGTVPYLCSLVVSPDIFEGIHGFCGETAGEQSSATSPVCWLISLGIMSKLCSVLKSWY